MTISRFGLFKRVLWCLISAVSDSLALQIRDFTKVKWSHCDMLLVCISISGLPLSLIIGLEEWGSLSYSYCRMDAFMMACWKDGMLERASKSHSKCHTGPEGQTKHDVTRERLKCESNLFIMGELCVCLCVWRYVVSLHFSHQPLSVQHRLVPPTTTL